MASFTPSPAPRRIGIGQRASVSRGVTPPAMPIRRTASRFVTPVRQPERLPSVRDDESVVSGEMDVDEPEEVFERDTTQTVFAKSEELTATFYATLPVEVQHILRNADFQSKAYIGDIDTLTGFAVVASVETCFVWKYAQALSGTPTCYILACPRDSYAPLMSIVYHALVPYGASREPGLILISARGLVHFWDSIGMGLAGGEHYSSSTLALREYESVTTLTRSDSQSYIASTSKGRLFHLSLTAAGGKYHLTSRPFHLPRSAVSFSRLLPTFWSDTGTYPDSGNINAVALGEKELTERDMWAMIETRLQRWKMSVEGWEELIQDEDLGNAVRTAVREMFASAHQDDTELDLEFIDFKLESLNKIILLVSYAGQEEHSSPRRVYSIIRLLYEAPAFLVQGVRAVPYQSTASSGAPMHPRLTLMLDGKLIAIQFGDAVTICARDNEYMDRLALKSIKDRTLAVGVVEGDSELLILTAATTIKARIDVDQVAKFKPETGRANLIQSIMTQAILYGSKLENPLQFSFPPEYDEDALMSGAEQLSRAVLMSDPKVVRAHHDLQAQMAGRRDRLIFLIRFINDSAALPKMSQRCRQRLEADAEKLCAASQLWVQHSEFIRVTHLNSVLFEAIEQYMNAIEEKHHDDTVRAFFRLKVEDIIGIFPHILQIVQNSAQDGQSKARIIEQANGIILTVLQSAISYRGFNCGVYGIEQPLIDPWSSQPDVLDILAELLDITAKLVERPTSDPAVIRVQVTTRDQISHLATCLFAGIQERLQWLESPLAAETGSSREWTDLDFKFRQLRPSVLEMLRRVGFTDQAFKLAEDYRDYRSLVSLCHRDIIYPLQDNPNATRMQNYIAKFKEEFTTELYQWYIGNGELRTMFAKEYDEYLDAFFQKHRYPAISWIHDLGRGRYEAASQSLLSEADHATELVSKHLMLSIGKLSRLAQVGGAVVTPIDQTALDAFHDGLDFIDVHETLADDFKSVAASGRPKQSLEMQVDIVVKQKASQLGDRTALQSVFKLLARQLLQGKALSAEDIADVLSLKNNINSLEDYVTALQILSRARNIPEARWLSAFRSVWRRIYIHDDWDNIRQTTGVTDEELSERLRHTAFYAALRSTMKKRHQPTGYILLPSEAVEIPDLAEVALRWPGMSPDEVEGIVQDYKYECDLLISLELDGMSDGIMALVAKDAGWANEE